MIFKSRSFQLYYAGQALSVLGDGLRTLAIPLLVFHLTGSALSLGFTYALQYLPLAVVQLVGGSLADRVDRRRLVIACDFVRFVIVAAFALAYWLRVLTLTEVYAGVAVIATMTALFAAAEPSSISYMLGKERSRQGIAAIIAAEQAANLIAPSAGGALFALGGALPALTINAFTYLSSQVSLALIDSLGPDEPAGPPNPRELLSDIRLGYRFLIADAALRTVTGLSLGLNLFGLMATAVFIPFVKRDFGGSDIAVGVSLGAGALGAIAGSLVAARFAHRWPFGISLCWAYLIDGVIFLPVLFAHELWVVVLFWSLANAIATFEVTQIVSWRIRVIPEAQIGRVFGAVRLVALIGIVPGTVIGGYLADHFGARLPIVVSGIGYLILAAVAFLVPALREDKR